MALDAYVGEVFVFQVYWTDASNAPLAVPDSNLTLLRYDEDGAEVVLFAAQPMVAAADPGRYRYRYTLPDALTDGQVLYAYYRGTAPGTGDALLSTEALNVHSRAGDLGLRSRFVR